MGRLKALKHGIKSVRNGAGAPRDAMMAGGVVVGAGLLSPQEAEAAPMGSLAKQIGKKTRQVFHGSPHDFDAFSTKAIGTGEGAQAYGHGLYFSSSEDVAKYYRDSLSGDETKILTPWDEPEYVHTNNGWVGTQNGDPLPYDEPDAILLDAFAEARGDLDEVRAIISEKVEDGYLTQAQANYLMQDAGLERMKMGAAGRLYTVEIPDESMMLDWDKPLSEQPEGVREVLESFKDDGDPVMRGLFSSERATGGGFYGTVAANMFDSTGAELSSKLKELGIPGITYEGDSSGVRNYVIFDDQMTNIVEKGFATPKALAATAAAAFVAKRSQKQDGWARAKAGGEVAIDALMGMVGPVAAAPSTMMDYIMGVSGDDMEQRKQQRANALDYAPSPEAADMGDKVMRSFIQGIPLPQWLKEKAAGGMDNLARAAERLPQRERLLIEAAMELF